MKARVHALFCCLKINKKILTCLRTPATKLKIMKNLILLSSLIFAFYICKSQTTITCQPTDDTWVYEANTSYNDCSNSSMGGGLDNDSYQLWPFIKFDISQIPPCVNITNAVCSLYLENNISGSLSFNVRRVTGTWSECAITWANKPSTVGGYGATGISGSPK